MAAAKKVSDNAGGAKGSSEGNFEPLHCPEMHVNIRLLRTFGLWSLAADTKGRRAAYRLYSCVAYGAHSIFVLSVCVQLWIYRSDLEQLTDNLSVTLAHTANICKIIPLFFMRQLVEAPLRTLRGLWASAEARGAAERAVQAATLRRVRRLSAAYVGLFLFTYSVWEGTALVRSAAAARRARADNHTLRVVRQLPVRAWYPFDISPSFNYQVAFWTQSVGFFYTVTSVCTTNLLYFVLVIHATTQFRVLRASLLRVRERALARVGAGAGAGDAHFDLDALGDDAARRRLDAAMRALLGDCVRHHQATLRYADQLRTLIDPIMFAECLTMSIQLCVLIFQATTQPLTSPLFLSEFAFLMCEMTQLFLHCYFGTELIHESLLIQDAAYKSNWYSAYSSGYRKSIVIMMCRALRQSHIKAFSFSTVSLELFTGLLKASYSYYTLLRQVHEEEEQLVVD